MAVYIKFHLGGSNEKTSKFNDGMCIDVCVRCMYVKDSERVSGKQSGSRDSSV